MAVSSSSIAAVAHHIKQAPRVCFIIGAGASKAAGIPMAGELVKMVSDNYGHCLVKLSETERQNYGKVLSCLSPAERKELITPLLENAGINWGQIALALMLQNKFVSRVLIFNFDLVLEKSAALMGIQLPVYDFGGAPTSEIGRIATPSILHLHGQSFGLVLLNTSEETERHRDSLRPLLADTVRNNVTIVCGYSGEADGAFEVIQSEFNSHNRLIWLGYEAEPAKHLKPLLDQNYAEYVGGCDFDLTMIKIAKLLDIWPPAIVANPMSHILEELSEVRDYPVQEESELDVLTSTRERLKLAAKSWAADGSDDDQSFAMLLKGSPGPEQLAKLAASSGDLTPKARDAASWTFITAGNALLEAARGLSGDAAQAKFAEAGEKYATALVIKPDGHDALNNWGIALTEAAKGLSGDGAQAKFAEAGEKFAAALVIKPDKHEALSNWGNALADAAKGLSGDVAQAKFAEAGEKFAAALVIKPNDHQALNNWGAALMEAAKGLRGDGAQAKFAEAEKGVRKSKALTGRGNFNLACIFALTNRPDAAMAELQSCLQDGTLPAAAHLDLDVDLDALRRLPDYVDFRKALN